MLLYLWGKIKSKKCYKNRVQHKQKKKNTLFSFSSPVFIVTNLKEWRKLGGELFYSLF